MSVRDQIIRGNMIIDPYDNVIPTEICTNAVKISNCGFAYQLIGEILCVVFIEGVSYLKLLYCNNGQIHGERTLLEDEDLRKIDRAFEYGEYIVLCGNQGPLFTFFFNWNVARKHDSKLDFRYDDVIGVFNSYLIHTDMKMFSQTLTGFSPKACWSDNTLYLSESVSDSKFSEKFDGFIQDAYVMGSENYLISVLINNQLTMVLTYKNGKVLKETLEGTWLTAPILINNVLYAVNSEGLLMSLAGVWNHYPPYHNDVLESFLPVYIDKDTIHPLYSDIAEYEYLGDRDNRWGAIPVYHGHRVILKNSSKSATKH